MIAAALKPRLKVQRDQIPRLFFPGYSPKLNPEEFLNQDVKPNAVGRHRPENLHEMIGQVRRYLRSTQRQPRIVKSYFRAPSVRYGPA